MGGSMFKKLILGLAFAGLFSPAYAAGTIPYSLSQQLDQYGKPLTGCRLYIIQAGTTNAPQNSYGDVYLTTPLPNPLSCDAAGRLRQFFLADGLVKVRLTDKNGVNQVEVDGVQVVGPSTGGGGGGGGTTVDATTILATGDVKTRYGTGALAGFVRMNGRTIGSATSGASERANADTQALFYYLWAADPTLTVTPSRGASADADWVANKTLAVPDGRGRVLAGLDDMGGTAAGILPTSFFGVAATTLGAKGGASNTAIRQDQLPAVSPAFFGAPSSLGLTTTVQVLTASTPLINVSLNPGSSTYMVGVQSSITSQQVVAAGTITPTGSISALGNGNPYGTIQPTILVTNYMKL